MEELNELVGLALIGFVFMWSILIYLIGLYPKYYMFKEANIEPWLAFLPIVSDAMLLQVIGWSPWLYLALIGISFIPVIGSVTVYVVSAVISWKVAEKFGLGTLGKVLAIFFFPFVQWYIALAKKSYWP